MAVQSVESTDPEFSRWVAEINRYESEARRWTDRSKKIVKRYKDERSGPADESATKYNILWSNLQVLIPAVYAKNPVPEVERRFKDEDPVGREASEVLERCIDYNLKTQPFKDVMRSAVLDRFLPGRGVVWIRYVPHFKKDAAATNEQEKDQGVQLTDDAEPQTDEKQLAVPEQNELVDYEECVVDYVHWQDFGYTVARTWQEVRGVWRIAYLTRQELLARFGEEVGSKIPLAASDSKRKDSTADELKKAVIYEIWDKSSKKALWLCKEYAEGLLDKKDDPLGLSGFFPCPRPIFATLGNDSMIPTPDYVMYQDQAEELDNLTARINSITKAVKVAGVHDASAQGIQHLLSEGVENQLISIDSWAAFAEKGGLEGAMQLLPMKDIAETLMHLYEAREKVKADLYEITGLADIIRGANDPSETATATRTKSQFASIRLRDIQDEVARFVRDALRIMGEVMAQHFGIETLAQISGVDLPTMQAKQQMQMQMQGQQPDPKTLEMLQKPTWEEVAQLLQNDAARNFRIDIETDSTIGEDEEQHKEQVLDYVETMSKFIAQAVPAIQQTPALGPLAAQMMMFAARAMKVGRSMENTLEATLEQLEQASQQPSKPDPEQVKAQAATAQIQAKAQADIQVNQDRVQGDIQIEQAKVAAMKDLETFKAHLAAQVEYAKQDAQNKQSQQENAMEAERARQQMAMEAHMEQMRTMLDAHNQQNQQQLQLLIAHMNNVAKVEVAEIAAETTLDAAQISAAKASEGTE